MNKFTRICPTCNGERYAPAYGWAADSFPCRDCDGTGKQIVMGTRHGDKAAMRNEAYAVIGLVLLIGAALVFWAGLSGGLR